MIKRGSKYKILSIRPGIESVPNYIYLLLMTIINKIVYITIMIILLLKFLFPVMVNGSMVELETSVNRVS